MKCQLDGCNREAVYMVRFQHVAPLEVCREDRGRFDGMSGVLDVVRIADVRPLSPAEQLGAALAELQHAYDEARAQLAGEFADPLQVRDQGGRFVLLDALTAIVAARTALAGGAR